MTVSRKEKIEGGIVFGCKSVFWPQGIGYSSNTIATIPKLGILELAEGTSSLPRSIITSQVQKLFAGKEVINYRINTFAFCCLF